MRLQPWSNKFNSWGKSWPLRKKNLTYFDNYLNYGKVKKKGHGQQIQVKGHGQQIQVGVKLGYQS